MSSLAHHFHSQLARHAPPPASLLLGYSGGLDSTVLLHLAQQHGGIRVRALHVHHGLAAQADAWLAHCQATCARWGVPLQHERVTVTPAGEGLEAAARHARHAAFARQLADGEWLTLAHHQDDQAETFLLHALRGSGVDGLAAMRPLRRFAHGWLWRPLLDVPRRELLAYARQHRLDWLDDPSNAQDTFARNYLRHTVLPLLTARWPHATSSLAQAAHLAAEARDLLHPQDTADLAHCRLDADATLSLPALLALPAARRARVMRLWLRQLGLPALPFAALHTLEREVFTARHDARAAFRWQDAHIECWRGQLHAGHFHPGLDPGWSCVWDGHGRLALPDGGELWLEGGSGFVQPVNVSARRGGERLRLPGRNHHHSLKKLLQAHAIPPWKRRHLPLLRCTGSGEILAVGDWLYSAHWAKNCRHTGAQLRWQRVQSAHGSQI